MPIIFYVPEVDYNSVVMLNDKAFAIMRIIGIEPAHSGEISCEELQEFLQKILKATRKNLNGKSHKDLDSDYVVRRLEQLRGLALCASRNNLPILWDGSNRHVEEST